MVSPKVYHQLARQHQEPKSSVLMYKKIIKQIDNKSYTSPAPLALSLVKRERSQQDNDKRKNLNAPVIHNRKLSLKVRWKAHVLHTLKISFEHWVRIVLKVEERPNSTRLSR